MRITDIFNDFRRCYTIREAVLDEGERIPEPRRYEGPDIRRLPFNDAERPVQDMPPRESARQILVQKLCRAASERIGSCIDTGKRRIRRHTEYRIIIDTEHSHIAPDDNLALIKCHQ